MRKLNLRYLVDWYSGSEDSQFLQGFKGDWNRVCNYYINHVSGVTESPGAANYITEKIEAMNKFGRLYEIFLKYKFLPDIKFVNTLDKPFWDTLKDMHDFLGDNPYPQDRTLQKDASYNVRYRGVMLIDYLEILSRQRGRYWILTLVKLSIYLIPIISVGLLLKQFLK
ncbi:hypothetical protein EPO05_05215 [Patescibacteria group bacterium]|nr:MAG: hypothetical protein EPO05_05215 [Patescibacteria group bacterium]